MFYKGISLHISLVVLYDIIRGASRIDYFMLRTTISHKGSFSLVASLAFTVVTLPSLHHRWSVSNSSVAVVESKTGLTSAQSLGVTAVIVEDTRVNGHTQLSFLNVVLPESLSLYILPLSISGDPVERMTAVPSGELWYVVSGRQYLVQVHIEENTIVDIDDSSSADGEHINVSNFRISAKHLGITTLYVSIRQQSGYEIVSQQIKIEVYVPPRIQPHSIFLVPGANYAVFLNGGPTIGIHVEYATMDDRVAIVNSFSGRLTAMSPGNTTVVSTLYGNGDAVICRAYGVIKVGVPSALLSVQSE